jgi:hypothetical protein
MREKMKTLKFKSASLLLASVILSAALNGQTELKKEYHREFTVTPSMVLDLSNKYGDIDIQTSETGRVIIDVRVTLRYPNREKAERLFSYIDVEFSEDPDRISARTVISSKFSYSGWSSDSRRFRIDYNVKMPEDMDLTLVNRYGNTILDDLSGHAALDIKYGNLTAGKLLRENEKPLNSIILAYGNGSVEQAGWLDAVFRYCSNFRISKSQALLIDSRYSKIQLGTVSSLVGDLKYDNLRIDKINNLVLNSGYTVTNIGTLTRKLEFDVSYGSCSIERVPAEFESIDLKSRYTSVSIGIDDDANYRLNGTASYGGLKFRESKYRNVMRKAEGSSTTVDGIIGNEESPASRVKIDAAYGSVKLF